MADLFDNKWQLDDLDTAAFGKFAFEVPSDEQKRAVWDSSKGGKPTRVPVMLLSNERVAVLDDRFDYGIDFEGVFEDPKEMLKAHLLHQYLRAKRYNLFCDDPCALPEEWEFIASFQNVYEARSLGSQLHYRDKQIPDTEPWLKDDNKRAVFDIDISEPLKLEPYSRAIEYYDFLSEYVAGKTFLDRPIKIVPAMFRCCDGPLTVAMSLRGEQILYDMFDDPDYADELFDFIVQAAINRVRAFESYYNVSEPGPVGFADDSIAVIGVEQYEAQLLKHHQKYYDSVAAEFGKRAIHLCGDATRHFPMIHDRLGVVEFDTGFPVDFAWLRDQLGPDVMIYGGVEVSLLTDGGPEEVYSRSKEILSSGVMAGKFVFRDANNLPPNVPWVNLAAFYKAALDFGAY